MFVRSPLLGPPRRYLKESKCSLLELPLVDRHDACGRIVVCSANGQCGVEVNCGRGVRAAPGVGQREHRPESAWSAHRRFQSRYWRGGADADVDNCAPGAPACAIPSTSELFCCTSEL